MSNDAMLPPSATGAERALAETGARVSDLPVPVSDLWNPQTCPAVLLPWLAWALRVDIWDAAWSETAKRAVIAGSIPMHRKKGTPWAIRTALASIGLPATEITEYETYRETWESAGGRALDGAWTIDGSTDISPPSDTIRPLALRSWAEYAIRLDITGEAWDRAQQRLIMDMAAQYAPARCHLRALIASAGWIFDAAVMMLTPLQRLAVRLADCGRFICHNWQVLDGCRQIGGGHADCALDGNLTISGWPLSGQVPVGGYIDSGYGDCAVRIQTAAAFSSGGDRVCVGPLVKSVALDGRLPLSGHKLDGLWALDDSWGLDYPTLATFGQPRLDGTWQLGRTPGIDQIWFDVTTTVNRDGVTGSLPLSGQMPIGGDLATHIKIAAAFSSGGDRIRVEPLVRSVALDGRLPLSGHKLDGLWALDDSWGLDYPTLATFGQPRLDGTWRLGRTPGIDQIWFDVTAATNRGGATYKETV